MKTPLTHVQQAANWARQADELSVGNTDETRALVCAGIAIVHAILALRQDDVNRTMQAVQGL